MEKQKTLILIDGHALAFRQYFALERTNMRTSEGTPTWAVFGFFKAIFDLLKNKSLKPDAICVTFDVSHDTFRVKKYKEYKANREAMPDPMKVQMGLINEGLKAFNIPVYKKEGYEADDVIGTISKQACELGHKVLILTGDQDAFQLIDREGCVKVIIPSKGELTEYDWQKVHDKLGVFPNQVVDYKSLRGDSSDNIPGVKGIGEKTAIKLLEKYGHLENILEDCENIEGNNVRKCFCADIEMAKMSYFLATILRDVDVNFDFASTHIELPDVGEVSSFLKRLQLYSFLKNIESILYSFNKNPQENLLPLNAGQQTQLGLFSEAVRAEINKINIEYKSKVITDMDDLLELVRVLKTKSLISFRTEADFKSAVENNIFGFILSYNDNYVFNDVVEFSDDGHIANTFYIPIAHHINKQLGMEAVVDAIKFIFEDTNIKKITHDVKIERNILRTVGINLKSVVFDTYLASYVKDSKRNHGLEAQAIENVEHIMDDVAPYARDSKINTSILDVSLDTAVAYASDILATMFELTKFWINTLEEKELKLLYNVEVPLALVLAEMEYVGISVDTEYLNGLSVHMADLLRGIEFKIYMLAGEAFNISSPKQVAEILFEKLGIKYSKKKVKNKYSTSAEVLEELAPDYEIVDLILQYRKYSKLKSTYTDALPELINPIDMRIHTTYNQTITTTGRLSSSNPNLQNIPIRTEEGNKLRRAFVPSDKERYLILSADYSQIELRLLAHVSGDEHLIAAFNSGEDVHKITASKVFGVSLDEVTKEMRYRAKAVNFGIVYGQSKYGLAKSLGISIIEAEMFINKYFETYPGVKKYMTDMVSFVQENGYVETTFGRKRNLYAELNNSNGMIREFAKRAAINQPMQGTAADLIKMAMIDLEKRMKDAKLVSKLIMQVHDELVVEVEKSELEIVSELVESAMGLNQPLLVPLVVDISVGETWQE